MKSRCLYYWLILIVLGYMVSSTTAHGQTTVKRYVQAGGGVLRANSGGIFHSGTFGETIVGRFSRGTQGFWTALLLPTPVREDNDAVPTTLTATPNPISSSTVISFSVPIESRVSVRITDALGQVVRTLTDEQLSAGTFQLYWNGNTDTGISASAGAYYCELAMQSPSGGNYRVSRLMLLLVR